MELFGEIYGDDITPFIGSSSSVALPEDVGSGVLDEPAPPGLNDMSVTMLRRSGRVYALRITETYVGKGRLSQKKAVQLHKEKALDSMIAELR